MDTPHKICQTKFRYVSAQENRACYRNGCVHGLPPTLGHPMNAVGAKASQVADGLLVANLSGRRSTGPSSRSSLHLRSGKGLGLLAVELHPLLPCDGDPTDKRRRRSRWHRRDAGSRLLQARGHPPAHRLAVLHDPAPSRRRRPERNELGVGTMGREPCGGGSIARRSISSVPGCRSPRLRESDPHDRAVGPVYLALDVCLSCVPHLRFEIFEGDLEIVLEQYEMLPRSSKAGAPPNWPSRPAAAFFGISSQALPKFSSTCCLKHVVVSAVHPCVLEVPMFSSLYLCTRTSSKCLIPTNGKTRAMSARLLSRRRWASRRRRSPRGGDDGLDMSLISLM